MRRDLDWWAFLLKGERMGAKATRSEARIGAGLGFRSAKNMPIQ